MYKRCPKYMPGPVKRKFDVLYYSSPVRKGSQAMHKGLDKQVTFRLADR